LEKTLFEILISKNPNNENLIIIVLDYILNVMEKSSILIIRILEIILNFIERLDFIEEKIYYFLSNSKNENEKIYIECIENNNANLIPADLENDISFLICRKLIFKYLFELLNIFYELDILTQLNFFDLAEKVLTKNFLIKLFVKKIDFFNHLNKENKGMSDYLTRKALYTYSKFYGKGALEYKNNILVKNILANAIQFYKFNCFDNIFILTIFTNCFHNKQIYKFFSEEDAKTDKQFDFLEEVICIILEICWDHNPDVQKLNLELLTLLGNFELPSHFQENFFKKFIFSFYKYEFNKVPENEIYAYKSFIQKLYKDFRLHDYEEYEFLFLETIYCKFFSN